jgi:hypothetical protein
MGIPSGSMRSGILGRGFLQGIKNSHIGLRRHISVNENKTLSQ